MEEFSAYGITGFNAYIYCCLYELVSSNSKRLARKVPDFIVDESLRHFEHQEQYEKCSMIKRFFDQNPKRMFPMSRHEWMDHGWQLVRA